MASRSVDFRAIRVHNGSQNGGFEELCCQLARLEAPSGPPVVRKGIGADGGLECYRVNADESETGWQAKYFFTLGDSELKQITNSFKHAVDTHSKLKEFIVCLPFDLPDGRKKGTTSARGRWDKWCAERKQAISPREIEISLWGASEITERLSRLEKHYAGRLQFWFGELRCEADWFRRQLGIARQSLGRRYTPELNIDLPIRRALSAFARDPSFFRRLERRTNEVDEALRQAIPSTPGTPAQTEAVQHFVDDVQSLTHSLRTASGGPIARLPVTEWREAKRKAQRSISAGLKVFSGGPNPRSLDQVRHFLYRLLDSLDGVGEVEAEYVDARALLVTGEAGVGKSHLLADIAERHLRRDAPAVLLLGSAFNDDEPWSQIVKALGLPASFGRDDLLGALDAAGETAGARALVIVDALNERNGAAVWRERLAGFLAAAEPFPHVAILLSCRSTMLDSIVDDSLTKETLPRLNHPGFEDHGGEAARRYLDQRGIVRMAMPYLAPEFRNPLLLRTCCDYLEKTGARAFPRGLAGVTSIFEFYFAAVTEVISNRMNLNRRLGIVDRAIKALTEEMVRTGSNYIPYLEAHRLVEEICPSANDGDRDLLQALESEGVVTVETIQQGSAQSYLRFTFERMSDHKIAGALLDQTIGDTLSCEDAFAEGGPLHPYVAGRGHDQFSGIAEAFAIQLPERYGKELPDLIQSEHYRHQVWCPFRLSILWRQQDTCTSRTFELLAEMDEWLGGSNYLSALLSVATEPKNPFNARLLDAKLRAKPMPERDAEWSIRITSLAKEGEESPVWILIDWTLSNGLREIEDDRIWLIALTLAWLFSLSHRSVRDRATKALACLLVNRRALAARLIRHFADVDDPYILDRVLAASYGAALRNHTTDDLADLARAAFEAAFAKSPMPVHALIRDHARGLVELACVKGGLPADIEIARARPPYAPGQPIEPISDAVLQTFARPLDAGDTTPDTIFWSADYMGDFAHYIIDPIADHFLTLPRQFAGISPEEIYADWHARVIAPYPERISALERVIEINKIIQALPSPWLVKEGRLSRSADSGERADKERLRDNLTAELTALLGGEEAHIFHEWVKDFIGSRMWSGSGRVNYPTYRGKIARRWIVWRAHDLGWTSERFQTFDDNIPSSGRRDHRIERIGKKYQWIALHELVGRLSDLAPLEAGDDGRPRPYDGPWQVGAREMDPSILVTDLPERDPEEGEAAWWVPKVAWRMAPPQERLDWAQDEQQDVPDVATLIDLVDPDGGKWLVLNSHWTAHQERMSKDGERLAQRYMWRQVKSVFVPRAEVATLMAWIRTGDHIHRDIADTYFSRDAYLGEYAWHPSARQTDKDAVIDSTDGAPDGLLATSGRRDLERGGHDHSITRAASVAIPSRTLMRGLSLRLADGQAFDYVAPDGRVLFRDPSTRHPGPSAAHVDRQALLDFLAREQLDIVWIVTGEKHARGGSYMRPAVGGVLELRAVCSMVDGSISGELTFKSEKIEESEKSAFLASE